MVKGYPPFQPPSFKDNLDTKGARFILAPYLTFVYPYLLIDTLGENYPAFI